MKTKLITFFIFCFFLSCSSLFAQSSYKNVIITRGDADSDKCHFCDWTKNCVYISNYNKYPVRVHFDYKLNSREAPWQSYVVDYEIPVSERNEDYLHTDNPGSMYQELACFNGEIKALRITFVDIIQPSAVEKVRKGVGDFVDGYNAGRNAQSQ